MGVTGLWRLIEPSGKPVPLETLENKVLAIDVSIWLHQAIKGFQDSQGAPLPNAHLLGIYHRVCKLLYFRIKPVFVFDGGVPHLKRETIVKRQQQRSRKFTEAESIQKQLLTTLLKHAAIKNVLSEKTKATLASPKTSPIKSKEADNLYKLPPTDFDLSVTSSDEETSTSDSSSPIKNWNLHTINEKSEHFKSLPPDVRHDILTELKETRKQSSWGKIHEMPKKSDDFSDFQMRRLLKRYSVQVSLDEVTKEMGGHSLSLAELEALLKDQGVVTTSSGSHIASDENVRYLLIKNVKKAVEEAKSLESKETVFETNSEYQKDLEAAIQLSLQDVPSTSKSTPEKNFMENFCDEDFQSSPDNSDSEKVVHLDKNLISAKNYMREYSGLTPTEIDKIIGEKTSPPAALVTCTDKLKCSKDISLDIPDSSDDEFLEVSENPVNIEKEKKTLLEILVNPEENLQGDDLFNDIFSNLAKATEANQTNLTETEILPNNEKALPNKPQDTSPASNIEVDHELAQVIITRPDACVKDMSFKIDNSIPVVDLESSRTTNAETMCDENVTQSTATLVQLENVFTDHALENNRESSQSPKTSDVEHKNTEDGQLTTGEIPVEISLQNNISVAKQIEGEITTASESSVNKDATTTNLADEAVPRAKHLTTEDLQVMAVKLRNEEIELESGRLAKERMANNLTDQIYQEAQELLQLFGVPYIVAPMEAEAQCAFLNSIKLTDGTITDDSDIWLFGGQTVYKHFFNQRKHVLEYRSENIQRHFKLTREQMILLALLVGSDYTTGLQGVGPVTALEILANFPPTDDLTSGLNTFRKWLSTDKTSRNVTLRNKLKNVTFTDGFPSLQVIKAYLEPTVDTNEEAFSWSKPDINGLLEFSRQKFGWHRVKSEEILKPVLKRLNENVTQKSIKDFFQTKHKIDGGGAEAKMSKRVKKAIESIGKGPAILEDDVGVKPKGRKKRQNIEDEDLKVLEETVTRSKRKVREIKTKIKKDMMEKPKVAPALHKKEVIPQKEKDKVDALRSKLKAIEVLRKSKKGPGYVPKKRPNLRKLKDDAELSESSSD